MEREWVRQLEPSQQAVVALAEATEQLARVAVAASGLDAVWAPRHAAALAWGSAHRERGWRVPPRLARR
jgi:hypothetical protein